MNETAIKATVAASLTAVFVYAQSLLIPLAIVVVAMLVDFGTGVACGWVRHELSSDIGRRGIIKKVAQVALIAVGAIVDLVLHFAGDTIGLEAGKVMIVCMLVIFWITANECISITENYFGITGKSPPAFLSKIIEQLKAAAENTLDTDADDGNEHGGS